MPLLRPFAAAAAAIFAMLTMETPAVAQQDDLYRVSGVEVDATAGSAVEARERALAEGHREAFARLVDRLTPRDGGSAPQISVSRIENLVRDFEVNNERTSSVRYLAELSFRFDPEAVRSLLRQERIDFAEARSHPLVVLPVLTRGGDSVLWDEPNPWRAAWAGGEREPSLVPIIAPLGDLSDISAIEVDQALQGDSAAISAIGDNYGTPGVLVAEARLSGDPESGGAELGLRGTRYLNGEREAGVNASVSQRGDEDASAFFRRATAALDRAVQEDWKRANVLDLDDRHDLRVRVQVDTLGDVTGLQRQLEDMSTIDRVGLRYLARSEAHFDISYFGGLDRLASALSRANLELRESETRDLSGLAAGEPRVWEILLPGRGAGGTAPRIEIDELEAPQTLGQGAAPAQLDADPQDDARESEEDLRNGTELDGGPEFGGSQGADPGDLQPQAN